MNKILNSILGKITKLFYSIGFILQFIVKLGGLGVLLKKMHNVYQDQGFLGLIEKAGYVFRHAKINSNYQIDTGDYQKWIRLYSNFDHKKALRLKRLIISFHQTPLISIILPVYNPHPKWLKAAIESVLAQVYQNWELCIADDASTNPEIVEVLKHYQHLDPRIKVHFRSENGHISAASNSALELAGGNWITLLDHDDLLTQDALFWVAETINKNSEARLIYSDEDKITMKGWRKDPYFKCNWNYSLFLSQNMISHLGVYHAEIVKKIGGFRQGFEGSQDYDLALRFIEKINHNQIYHIPRILYHWRVHQKSTSSGSEIKKYALAAGIKALEEHLKRIKVSAKVELMPSLAYRVKYCLPDNPPKISIIIPSKNNKKILTNCIESIISKTTWPNFEVLVVDNNSDDPETKAFLLELTNQNHVKIISDTRPFNFSAINNQAVKNARGEYICFLNDDTEVISPDWLSEMVGHAVQPGVGVVGAKLWYPNDSLQHAGVILGIGGVAGHSHKYLEKNDVSYFNRTNVIQEFSAVTAACMLVQKKIFVEAEGFDEINLTVAFNDVDLCLKIKALGYRIVWTTYAELYHHESVSRGNDFHPDKIERFMKENDFMLQKWGKLIRNDPAYSPNLTLENENFGLAWPPRIEGI